MEAEKKIQQRRPMRLAIRLASTLSSARTAHWRARVAKKRVCQRNRCSIARAKSNGSWTWWPPCEQARPGSCSPLSTPAFKPLTRLPTLVGSPSSIRHVPVRFGKERLLFLHEPGLRGFGAATCGSSVRVTFGVRYRSDMPRHAVRSLRDHRRRPVRGRFRLEPHVSKTFSKNSAAPPMILPNATRRKPWRT